MILNLNKDKLDTLDLVVICNEFAESEHRLSLLVCSAKRAIFCRNNMKTQKASGAPGKLCVVRGRGKLLRIFTQIDR